MDIFQFVLYQKVNVNLISNKGFMELSGIETKDFNKFNNDEYYKQKYTEYQEMVFKEY